MHHTLIAGMGNVLMGDDAIGPTMLAHLAARFAFAEGVKLQDLGTPGMDLALHLAGVRTAVLVDALIDPLVPPGTVRIMDKDDLLAGPAAGLNPHAPDLREALLLAAHYGDAPERVCLIGIAVEDCSLGDALTDQVAAALPALVDAVTAELRRMDVDCEERVPPDVPDLWWKR